MGLLQAPLLPTPRSKCVTLTLLLPVPLGIVLSPSSKPDNARHAHSGSQPVCGPMHNSRTGVTQSLSVVLWLWDGSESPGQLGALCAMLTSSRKQSQSQQVKKQTTKGWAFGSVSCQDTRGLLFTSFGFQSHSLDLHLFRSYCVSFLTLLQVGLNPVPPLRW